MLDKIARKLVNTLPPNKIDIFGQESLMFSCLPYFMLVIITFLGKELYLQTGNSFLVIFIIYSLIPLLDQFFSLDDKNPKGEEVKILETNGWKFDIPLYTIVIYDWYMFYSALQIYENYQVVTLMGLLNLLGFVFINSNLNSAQFAVAHELMHKPGFKRWLGTIHMIKTLNIHFTYEHVFGHHRKVATQQDPASAQKGMTVYNFFVKSYFGAYKSVFQMEKQSGKHLWQNKLILSILASVGFCGIILYNYSLRTFGFFLIQVFGAVFYLEVINYIEHYGLRRKKNDQGLYEKVTPRHSWNSPHRFSNYLFFKLQRHSDHHENSMKPYQILLTVDQAPQLPHGYIVMTVMALFPQQFMRIMDPLVDEYSRTTQNGPGLQNIYKFAFDETRIFVMKITVCTVMLFLVGNMSF